MNKYNLLLSWIVALWLSAWVNANIGKQSDYNSNRVAKILDNLTVVELSDTEKSIRIEQIKRDLQNTHHTTFNTLNIIQEFSEQENLDLNSKQLVLAHIKALEVVRWEMDSLLKDIYTSQLGYEEIIHQYYDLVESFREVSNKWTELLVFIQNWWFNQDTNSSIWDTVPFFIDTFK